MVGTNEIIKQKDGCLVNDEKFKKLLKEYTLEGCKDILASLSCEHYLLDDDCKKYYPDVYGDVVELALLCIEKQMSDEGES